MSTDAQIIANTTNAQLSKGPVTPEGKARSATNATKLGFYAKQAVLITEEDHRAFESLTVAFRFELHPAGPVERALYSQIVLAAWNIERANRLEAGLAADGADPLLSDANEKTLNRIATFRMRAERTFHKCLKEIQTYQAAHPLDEPPTKNEAKSEMKNEPKLVRPALIGHKSNPEPYVQPAAKVGRNGHCPCNSGRKYKNCCLRNEPNSLKEAMAA